MLFALKVFFLFFLVVVIFIWKSFKRIMTTAASLIKNSGYSIGNKKNTKRKANSSSNKWEFDYDFFFFGWNWARNNFAKRNWWFSLREKFLFSFQSFVQQVFCEFCCCCKNESKSLTVSFDHGLTQFQDTLEIVYDKTKIQTT